MFSSHLAGPTTSEIREMAWYSYVIGPSGERDFHGDLREDWMGSLDKDEESVYFGATSVYNDVYDDGSPTFTISLWPTVYSALYGTGADTDRMWPEIRERTPLPDGLEDWQYSSLYKQLWCHAQYAKGGLGGDTWDLEANRPNISWGAVKGLVDQHECNWNDGNMDVPPPDSTVPIGEHRPVVDAGPDVDGKEGAGIRLDGSARDVEGPPSVRWTYRPLDGVDDGAACAFADESSVSTAIWCTDDGRFEVTLTADDGITPPVSDSAIVSVRNVAPKLKLADPEPWQVFRVGDRVRLDASFRDPGSNDTHTCKVAWDDGTAEKYRPEGRSCDRGRVFDEAGMYTVDLTVTDDDGGSDTKSVMVVVYDPRAGLLTGAGKAGEATFAAVAKYPATDSTEPLGTFTLSAPAGDERLTFTTTDLEWLVITPEGEVALKGEAGSYGFVAYLSSGRFRAVVWDLSEGDVPSSEVVYDTVPGASYDVDEAKPKRLSLGATVVDGGWIPGLPPPVGAILDDLL